MKDSYCMFIVSPNVYISLGRQGALFIDVDSGEYVKTNDEQHVAFAKAIMSKATRAVRCADFTGHVETEFMELLVKKHLGIMCSSDAVPYSHVFQPFEYIVDDIARWRSNGEHALLRQAAPQLLSELTVYVSNQCSRSCPHCHYLYKQVRCCNKHRSGLMSPSMLGELLRDAQTTALGRVHLVVPPDQLHQCVDEYGKVVSDLGFKYDIWTVWNANMPTPAFSQCDCELKFVVPLLDGCYSDMKLENGAVAYHFCVASEADLDVVNELIDRSPGANVALHPVFNGENGVFLMSNVLLSEDDIVQQRIGMRGVIRNKRLNANTFGELCVFANGEVKAAPYSASLGNVTNVTLSYCTYLELSRSDSLWLKTRRTVEACADCLYVDLCPPPMSIEVQGALERVCNVGS